MNSNGRGRGRKSPLLSTNEDYDHNNNDMKKEKRREIERQRRQEMSINFASLRSILPDQYIKGKRSISDHIAEAVNYIKDSEKNVKELGEKRDELKKLEETNPTDSKHEVGGSSTTTPGNVVVIILPRLGGSELEINVSHHDTEEFSLSNVLQLVMEEGLHVISCTSARINKRLVHNILCQVSEIACIDANRLQQKLMNLGC